MKRYKVVVTPFAAGNIREAHEWLAAEMPGIRGQRSEINQHLFSDL